MHSHAQLSSAALTVLTLSCALSVFALCSQSLSLSAPVDCSDDKPHDHIALALRVLDRHACTATDIGRRLLLCSAQRSALLGAAAS